MRKSVNVPLYDNDLLVTQLAHTFHRTKDVQLSSACDWYLQALFIFNNLPDQHPAKKRWGERVRLRKDAWLHYLDVLARDEHFKRTQENQTLNF